MAAVSSRNISSSPAPSAGRSSSRGTPAARATLPTSSASASARNPPSSGLAVTADAVEGAAQGVEVAGPDEGAGAGEQLRLGAVRDDPAVADHDEVVGDDLDLVEQVRGEQHGAAAVGVLAQQVAHPADAAGSRPLAGSSRTSDAGSPMSATAMPRRWRIPRE